MNRFFKTTVILLVAIFALVTGVDTTLDHMAACPSQSAFNWYNDRGDSIISYHGNLAECPAYLKPGPVGQASLIHRTGYVPRPVD